MIYVHVGSADESSLTPERLTVLQRVLGISQTDWNDLTRFGGNHFENGVTSASLEELIEDYVLGSGDVIDIDGLVPLSVLVAIVEQWEQANCAYPRVLCAEVSPSGEFLRYVEITSVSVYLRQWESNGEVTGAQTGLTRFVSFERRIERRDWPVIDAENPTSP